MNSTNYKKVSVIIYILSFILSTAIVFLITQLVFTQTAFAQTEQDCLYYEETEINGIRGYRIGYQGIEDSTRDIVISTANTPSNLPVLEIDNYAFTGSRFNSITILDSGYPINIKAYAFNGCEVNTYIHLPNTATFYDNDFGQADSMGRNISEGVFADCTAQSITLPEGLTLISDDMFNGCRNLTELKIINHKTNELYGIGAVGKNSFKLCQAIQCMTVPISMENLGENAFSEWLGNQTILFKAMKIPQEWHDFCGKAQIKESGLWIEYSGYGTDGWIDKYETTQLNIPPLAGYNFLSWMIEEDNLRLTDSSGKIIIDIKNYTYLKIIPEKQARNYRVTLNNGSGSGGTTETTVTYGQMLPSNLKAPTRVGYDFCGYAYNGVKYYDRNMTPIKAWDIADNATLVASWAGITCYVTLDLQGGTQTSGDKTAIFVYNGGTMSNLKAPTRYGYTFQGYYTNINGGGTKYLDNKMVLTKKWDIPKSSTTLYAYWTANKYLVKLASDGGTGGTTSVWATFDQPMPKATAPSRSKYDFVGYYSQPNGFGTKYYNSDMSSAHNWVLETNSTLPLTLYAAWKEKSCVAAGTMITLSNGKMVPVETLTGNEQLLVWNLKTGEWDSAPILFIDKDPIQQYEVIELTFSDNTIVKVISEHAFWDYNLNQYVYLDKYASQYIGHWFNKCNQNEEGEFVSIKVQLTNVTIKREYTTAWSPVTQEHLCYYVNGMLSIPGGIDGLFNIFEVNADTMKYDRDAMNADLETYGLFTYEEFIEHIYVSQEVFDAFNAQYLKVALGKGLITWDTLEDLVRRYAEYLT